MKTLGREFYDRDSVIVAKELLGKVLVHELDGQRISAKIVETEAYMGVEDKAAEPMAGLELIAQNRFRKTWQQLCRRRRSRNAEHCINEARRNRLC